MVEWKKCLVLAWLALTSRCSAWITPSKHVGSASCCKLSSQNDESSSNARRPSPRRPIRPHVSTQQQQESQLQREKAIQRHSQALQDPTLLSDISFRNLNLSPGLLRAVTADLGLQRATEVQAKTLVAAADGRSIVGHARTGTGKTLAFLLPSLERLSDVAVYQPGQNVGIIILAPTRELVLQIAQQVDVLVRDKPKWSVQTVCGGTKIQRDRVLLSRLVPTVMVATPGRLVDLCKDRTRCHGNRLFRDVLRNTKICILDEADRLLEAFPNEIEKVLTCLPRVDQRQTLVFSATISHKLKARFADETNRIMPLDHILIDCVREGKVLKQNNARVEQFYLDLPDMRSYLTGLITIVNEHVASCDDSKIIVFFPTAKITKFMAEIFNEIGLEVAHIHSRMSQGARNRASSHFREGKQKILLSSDVSARGIDFPDVTLVVQYGAPYNEKLYLHRLGRTGRAGSQGRGLLVLLPFEKKFKKKLKSMRVEEYQGSSHCVDLENFESKLSSVRKLVRGGHSTLRPSAEAACKSFIAHYVEYSIAGVGSAAVEQAARELGDVIGLRQLPVLPNDLKDKLSKKGI